MYTAQQFCVPVMFKIKRSTIVYKPILMGSVSCQVELHCISCVHGLRHSNNFYQETLYYHGYTTSEMTGGVNTSPTNDRSTLPSLNLSEGAHNRLITGQCDQLPPLASPLVLSKRAVPVKEPASVRTAHNVCLI